MPKPAYSSALRTPERAHATAFIFGNGFCFTVFLVLIGVAFFAIAKFACRIAAEIISEFWAVGFCAVTPPNYAVTTPN
jgi:hypothetical protein